MDQQSLFSQLSQVVQIIWEGWSKDVGVYLEI